jgi:hypothetical protein
MDKRNNKKERKWILDGCMLIENTHACWLWNRATEDGYSYVISRKDPSNLGHVYSYRMFKNNIIPDGMNVYHTCKNRLCINPYHLNVGSWEDTQDY